MCKHHAGILRPLVRLRIPLISTNTADRAGFRNGFSCVEESRRNFANARFTLDDEAERPATCCSEWPVVAWLALLALLA